MMERKNVILNSFQDPPIPFSGLHVTRVDPGLRRDDKCVGRL